MAHDRMAATTQCVNFANIVGIMLRDELDQRIVALLVANGRATFAEIGDAVGLSAPAAKRRVDRLVAERTITGFTALVDPEAAGAPPWRRSSSCTAGVAPAPRPSGRSWPAIPR